MKIGKPFWDHPKIIPDQTIYLLHKKWSSPLRISSVKVTKSAVSCRFDHIYWSNPSWKTSFFVQWLIILITFSPICFNFHFIKSRLQPQIKIPETWPEKRQIIWFNPCYSKNVDTKVGKFFLSLISITTASLHTASCINYLIETMWK